MDSIGLAVNLYGNAASLVGAVRQSTAALQDLAKNGAKPVTQTNLAFDRLTNQIEIASNRIKNVTLNIDAYAQRQARLATVKSGLQTQIEATQKAMQAQQDALAKIETKYKNNPSMMYQPKINAQMTIAVKAIEEYQKKLADLNEELLKTEEREARVKRQTEQAMNSRVAGQKRIENLTAAQQAIKPKTTGFWDRISNVVRPWVVGSGSQKPGYKAAQGVASGLSELFGQGKADSGVMFDRQAAAITKLGAAASIAQAPVRVLFGSISAGVAVGNLAASAITSLAGSFVNMGKQAVGYVASFEKMTVTLNTMVAGDKMAKDSKLDLATAMKQTKTESLQLLQMLEKLAIISPFTEDEVKNTFMMAKRYGFMADESYRITKALTDWASATGQTGFNMEHVVWAMGQMRTYGKVNAQDINQMANAGLDLSRLWLTIGRQMGKSTEEIIRMKNAGLLPVETVLKGIVTYMESFSGAAKSQAESFSGLLSTLSDVAPKFLREFFGPMNAETGKVEGVLGAIQKRLASIVSIITNPAVLQAVRGWGVEFGKIAENAMTWGQNIVIQFANGIFAGAGAVLDALNYIGQMITYWLMPGSPPRLLPELDKWGQEAIQVYLGGWTEISGSVFDQLSSRLESFIRSLPDIGKDKLIPTINAMRNAIAMAVTEWQETGRVSGDTFNKIIESLGAAGPKVRGYVQALLDASIAQKKLDEITAAWDKKLEDLNNQLNAMDERAKQVSEEQAITRQLAAAGRTGFGSARQWQAEQNVQRIKLERAQREAEKAREKALAAAKKELEEAQRRLAAQERILAIQEKNNALMEEQVALLERLADAMTGLADALNKPKTNLGLGGLKPEDLKVEMPEALKKIIEKVDVLRKKWNEFLNQPGVRKLIDSAKLFISAIQEGIPFLDSAELALKNLFGVENWQKIEAIKNTAIKFIEELQKIPGKVSLIIMQIGNFFQGIITWWQDHYQDFATLLKVWWDLLVLNWTNAVNTILLIWTPIWNTILLIVTTVFDSIMNAVGLVAAAINGDWSDMFEHAKNIFTINLNFLKNLVVTIFTGAFNIAKRVIESIVKTAQDVVYNIVDIFNNPNNSVQVAVRTLCEKIAAEFTTIKTNIEDMWNRFVIWLIDLFNNPSGTIRKSVADLMGKIGTEFTNAINSAKDAWQRFVDWLNGLFGGIRAPTVPSQTPKPTPTHPGGGGQNITLGNSSMLGMKRIDSFMPSALMTRSLASASSNVTNVNIQAATPIDVEAVAYRVTKILRSHQ